MGELCPTVEALDSTGIVDSPTAAVAPLLFASLMFCCGWDAERKSKKLGVVAPLGVASGPNHTIGVAKYTSRSTIKCMNIPLAAAAADARSQLSR